MASKGLGYLLAAVVVATTVSAASAAPKNGRGPSHDDAAIGISGEAGVVVHGGGVDLEVRIGTDARHVIESYYRDAHWCPPGLAKKNRDCLPPGQAKKSYTIGGVLPPHIDFGHLPGDLARRLPPPPGGYIYGHVDGDILLIAEATHRVVDAVVAVDAAINGLSR